MVIAHYRTVTQLTSEMCEVCCVTDPVPVALQQPRKQEITENFKSATTSTQSNFYSGFTPVKPRENV